MPIRVGLAEDQLHTRMGLAALIGESADLEVWGQYSSMEEALTAIAQDPPDVLCIGVKAHIARCAANVLLNLSHSTGYRI